MSAIPPINYVQMRSVLLSKLPKFDGDSRIENSSISDGQFVLPAQIGFARDSFSSLAGNNPGIVQISADIPLVDLRSGKSGRRELTFHLKADSSQDTVTFDSDKTSAVLQDLNLNAPFPEPSQFTLCDRKPNLDTVDLRFIRAAVRRLEVDTYKAATS